MIFSGLIFCCEVREVHLLLHYYVKQLTGEKMNCFLLILIATGFLNVAITTDVFAQTTVEVPRLVGAAH